MTRTTTILFAASLLFAAVAHAGDDPSIQGQLRTDIGTAMQDFLTARTVDGTYQHFDPVEGKLLHLTDANLHSGIVKKGDFYVSCADFTDQRGRKLDLDFLVLDTGGELETVQGLVHKIDGVKRPYDLEQ